MNYKEEVLKIYPDAKIYRGIESYIVYSDGNNKYYLMGEWNRDEEMAWIGAYQLLNDEFLKILNE